MPSHRRSRTEARGSGARAPADWRRRDEPRSPGTLLPPPPRVARGRVGEEIPEPAVVVRAEALVKRHRASAASRPRRRAGAEGRTPARAPLESPRVRDAPGAGWRHATASPAARGRARARGSWPTGSRPHADRPADPPGRVGRELVAAPPVELLHARFSPITPSWTRSRSGRSRPWYRLAMEITRRRFELIIRSFAAASPRSTRFASATSSAAVSNG